MVLALVAQSTMTGQVSSWLLQCYLLLLLVHPLDPSSHPGQGPGISGLHAKELELWDMDPEPTPWVNMNVALLSKTCLLVELLITGIVLGRYLRRRLRRGRREVREGDQAGRMRQTPRVLRLLGSPLAKAPWQRGAEPLGGNQAQGQPRAEAAELCLLQPLLGAAQPGPSVSLRGQRQPQRPWPHSAPLPLPSGSLCFALQEKRQSPSAPAGQGCCPEHGCPTKLMQLLKRNRTMLQLCLQHCSQQKKAKRGAQGGFWKRRRFRASPKH